MTVSGPTFANVSDRSPVVREHPLNQGRQSWWLPIPGGLGGATLRDLMDRYPAQLGGSPAWSAGPPTSAACIRLNGSTQYIDTGVYVQDIMPSAGTVACTFRPWTAYNSGTQEILWFAAVLGVNEFSCQHYVNNNIYAGFNGGGNDSRVIFPADPANWPQNQWVTWTLTWRSATAAKLYVNGGELVYTAGQNTTPLSVASPLQFGRYYPTGALPFHGDFAEMSLWNRALSASEIAQLHDQSRRGYPDLLRRRRGLLAQPGPLFRPWLAGRAATIGTGVY